MTGEDWKFPISSDRLVAILKYRGMDAEALIVAQQRNIRSFVEAQESFAKGIEQLVDAQSGMLRGSVDRVSEVLPELAKQRSLQDMAEVQLDYQRKAAEAALTNLQQMTQMIWRQQRSAFELMNQTLMDSLQNLVKRTNGVAGPGSGNGHDKGE